jgi:3-oxoacid CoA-transferase subunit B/acetate CoA/acetoacetate CoA-transferase beta subunit
MDAREIIARRAAQEFTDGMIVNLGIGIPTGAANYIPDGVRVILQTENGALSFGPKPSVEKADPDNANAGSLPVTLLEGAAAFDLSFSFVLIRGGHVDMTVLGALEVDQNGSIANWKIPGKYTPGMGGGMDLLMGARKVVAATTHTNKKGVSKIKKKCSLPLSAASAVDRIITDLAVIDVTTTGLVLKEVAPGIPTAEVIRQTEAELIVPDSVPVMPICQETELSRMKMAV